MLFDVGMRSYMHKIYLIFDKQYQKLNNSEFMMQ